MHRGEKRSAQERRARSQLTGRPLRMTPMRSATLIAEGNQRWKILKYTR